MKDDHQGEQPQSPEEEALLESFGAMSEPAKEKFLRFSKRSANKPEGMDLSFEQMWAMLDNDTDVPRH